MEKDNRMVDTIKKIKQQTQEYLKEKNITEFFTNKDIDKILAEARKEGKAEITSEDIERYLKK